MKFGKLALWLWGLFIASVAFHQLITWVPANNFLISLIANMQWQIAAGFLLAAMVAWFFQQGFLGIVAGFYAALLGVAAQDFKLLDFLGAQEAGQPTIYLHNVGYYASQDDPATMAEQIASHRADFFVLIEPSAQIDQALSTQLETQPAVFHEQFGLGCAIWARDGQSVTEAKLVQTPNGAPTCLVSTDDWELLTVHPIPPVWPRLFEQHLAYLDLAETWLNAPSRATRILVGDFNMSYKNPHIFKRFKRLGTDGVTWGKDRLKTMLFSMPLDFAALPNTAFGLCLDVQKLDTLGSDHNGLLIRVSSVD